MLPAYAGMIRFQYVKCVMRSSAPRVCGDDPLRYGGLRLALTVLPAYAGMIPAV